MGRKRRTWSADHFYHVVSRGNRRDALFKDVNDFKAFLYILDQTYEKTPFELSAYCLMTNHYHLQIRSQEQPLSKVMALLNKRYANYYNTKYQLTGHVYEKRYFDKLIDSPKAMLEISRYIHLNPLKAHMVKHPKDYPWSSYTFYSDNVKELPRYMNLDVIRGACHAPNIVE